MTKKFAIGYGGQYKAAWIFNSLSVANNQKMRGFMKRKISPLLAAIGFALFVFAANGVAQDLNTIFNQGIEYYDAKRYEQAAESFRQVIAKRYDMPTAHY